MNDQLRPLGGACAWKGSDLASGGRWRRRLGDADVAEIEAALEHVLRRGVAHADVTSRDFPLPGLSRQIAEMLHELEQGCGMVHLSGLPVWRYGDDELRTLWVGLGSHFGALRYQNAHGELVRAIRDEGPGRGERYGQVPCAGGAFLSSRARVASAGELRFHTDRADVVALLCVRAAKSGGMTRIASSVAVHDEMVRRAPELAPLLYQDIHRSRLGEEVGGERASFALPVFGVREGRFTSHFSRTYIEAAQLQPGVPAMSAQHWRALDLLAELCHELCLELHFQPGDIQLLNSHVTYHARTAYEDHEGRDAGRLLYRLWICPQQKRPLPPGHEVLWGDVSATGLRGGIGQAA